MRMVVLSFILLAGVGGTARAQGSQPLGTCASDAVISGTVCIDKYEASVWRVPNPLGSNKKLVSLIQQGRATEASLIQGGATQLGVPPFDPDNPYAPCASNGQNCANDIYAVSLPGVMPSQTITWFQAQVACKNARKRLPSNAEWQAAVAGTPDPGPDNGTTDCNTASVGDSVLTGSRSACVSSDGAFDMVGNLAEWVADWVPRNPTSDAPCLDPDNGGFWGSISLTDCQGLLGASTQGPPGVLVRGGGKTSGEGAGPFWIFSTASPGAVGGIGVRCVR